MKKIIIVDDEMLTRIGIKSSLNWEKHGFKIVGQAENGLKALELIDTTHPDIVITDLRMPKMDGLELIEEIKKRFPNIKIVVLSCLNEIDYVKKALKLGADDYILKLSIEPESLLEVLNEIKQQIESESHEDSLNKIIHQAGEEVKVNQYVLKEDLFRKMIAGSIGATDFAKEMSALGISIVDGDYAILCCSIDGEHHKSMQCEIDDRYLLKYSFINILEEILYVYNKCEIIEIDEEEYIILLKQPSGQSLKMEGVLSTLKQINNSLKKYLNLSVSFGVSLDSHDYTQFEDAYATAKTAMQYKFYFGRESIIFTSKVTNFVEETLFFSSSHEKELKDRLGSFDKESVKVWINDYFTNLVKIKYYQPQEIRKVSAEICISLMKFIKRYGVKDNFMYSSSNEHPFDFLLSSETLGDIKSWFSNLIDLIYVHIYESQLEVKRPEIKMLQRYIAENISENITLDKASEITNMSKSYLSTIFKDETGEGFIDYLNRTKMERAKVLIQQGYKVYEAAEKVGIIDNSYFSKLFKRYIGQSPSKVQHMTN